MTDKQDREFNEVEKRIDKGNFDGLSDMIENIVDSSIDFARNAIFRFSNKNKANKKIRPIDDPDVCVQRYPEKSKATWFRIGAGCSIFMAICSLILVIGSFSLWPIISAAIFSLIAFGFVDSAKKIDKRSMRYSRYLKELNEQTAITTRDLCTSVNLSEADCVADLRTMMNKGYFKQARLVEKNQLFLLDIPTYKAYKGELDKKNILENANDPKQIEEDKKNRATDILDEGKKYLDIIDDIKQKIENRSVYEKVIKIETTISNILSTIKKYPDEVYALNKFMDYYLPTTIKLLNSYLSFEMISTRDQKMIESMKEIEKSLETINSAFEKILVQLYEDKSIDVRTDIDALRTILKQEGLIENEFGGRND
ncbi:MAG: 5-bromo-4-chloroindolyl phosphate hydrolysis family protein [Tissierellia bacterium]|nr:5-bromo-4-chloroindolyl phosphate hydrolysis family protein [Tissierellia bacterium]